MLYLGLRLADNAGFSRRRHIPRRGSEAHRQGGVEDRSNRGWHGQARRIESGINMVREGEKGRRQKRQGHMAMSNVVFSLIAEGNVARAGKPRYRPRQNAACDPR